MISRGNNVPEGMEEWRARVEYAPYQKTPRGKTHRDKREGTIERDASYVKFVKDLEAQMEGPPVAPMSAEQALERREAAERASSGKGDFKVSALLKYVMDKKKKEMALRTATKAAKAAAKGGKRAGGKDAKQQREVGHGRRDKKGAKGGGKGGAKHARARQQTGAQAARAQRQDAGEAAGRQGEETTAGAQETAAAGAQAGQGEGAQAAAQAAAGRSRGRGRVWTQAGAGAEGCQGGWRRRESRRRGSRRARGWKAKAKARRAGVQEQ